MTTPLNLEVLKSIACVTPLYHFASDTADLSIADGISVRSLGECSAIEVDQDFARHLHIFQPDYLLWDQCHFHGETFGEELSLLINAEKAEEVPGSLQRLVDRLIAPTGELLRLFRLFKPGRIRAGETFILWKPATAVNEWESIASTRASGMVVDYSLLIAKTTSYVLNSADIPLFHTFRMLVEPILARLSSFPTLEAAVEIYGAENGERLDAVGAITALEGLLSASGDSEGLAYRLALRIANLLGRDAHQRKGIFKEVKGFYDLRSKIVHGTALKTKQVGWLKNLDLLREMLRTVLLSVLGLVTDGFELSGLPDLLDDLALDDERRKQVQVAASKFISAFDTRLGATDQ